MNMNNQDIADLLRGRSLTPDEAESFIKLVKLRTNSRPANLAEIDALASSTKKDMRKLDERIATLESLGDRIKQLEAVIGRIERDPSAGNGGGGYRSPRLDKMQEMASDAATSFLEIRAELQAKAEALAATKAAWNLVTAPVDMKPIELTSEVMRRAVPIELIDLAKQADKIEADLIEAHKRDDRDAIRAIRRTDEANNRAIVNAVRRMAKGA